MFFQIIDADYTANGKPMIRLFGKTEKGNTACLFYDNFLPYFFAKIEKDMEKSTEKIRKISGVVGIEETEKFIPMGYQEKPTKMFKITLTNPKEVPIIREKLLQEKLVEEIFESDILFKYRFMVDFSLHGMSWVKADVEKTFTKTVKVPAYHIKKIEPVEKKDNVELKILSFDIECLPSDPRKQLNPKTDQIIMISLAFSHDYRGKKNLVLTAKHTANKDTKGFSNEKEMLEEFIKIVNEFDADIITGYNCNAFDLPYLLDRLQEHKIPPMFGRCNDKPCFIRTFGNRANISKECIVPGRIVADPYQILKRDPWIRLHKYTLGNVAKELLNEEKGDVEYSEMSKLWNGSKEDLLRFIEYSRKDAVLNIKLILERRLLDKFVELSKLSGVLMQDCFGGQTNRVETMLLHEFRKRNFVMPPKPERAEMMKRNKEREKKGLKGAVVLEPKKGLHAEGCTLVLDFKSLYPSLMRTYNISPDSVLLEDKDIKKHTSPTGACFIDNSIYQGIFPQILSKLIETRQAIKKQMKTAEGNEKRSLNAKQLAIKDMSNSFYGYSGYVRARLYLIDVANSITGYGRENIEFTKNLIEKNFDVDVVYGDSVTADRFVTLMNKENFIEVKNIEELFEQHKEKTIMTADGKERIFLNGFKALTINQETKNPEWSDIKEIIRHKTKKKIYRVNQKFGETVVTEDHSLITDDNGRFNETKPSELEGKKIARVECIPPVRKIEEIDMYELLKNYKYRHLYKGRAKTARFHCDNEYVWFGWMNRKSHIKIRRFISTDSPEFDALCKLMGAYIAEGSSSTMETADRYGCSIATGDIEWLKELQLAYEMLFENTESCIIQSSNGIRELSYGDKKILYYDKTCKLQMMNSLAAVVFKVLCGQKSSGKQIPSFMFHVKESKQNIMLFHMLKGDGYIEKNIRYSDDYKSKNFRYDTKSLLLISCISLLLTMQGKKYTIKFRKGKQVYRITTCSNYNKRLRTLISEEHYDGYVYDIAVDKNHMFVDACGQILLHNTDSLFVKTPTTNLNDAKELGEKISKFVTEKLPGYLELDFEKIYRTFLILSKKRYAGWKFEYSEGWKDSIDMRGIETVRRDWCPLVSETMMNILNIILKEGDVQKSIDMMKIILEKLRKNEIPLEKLTVVKGITRGIESYKGMLPHIELARKLAERNPHDPPKVGDRLGFVIIKGNHLLSKRAEDPKYIKEKGLQIDSDYYINSQLLPPIERILEAVGIEKEELLGGGHQISIFDLLSGKKRKMRHEISIVEGKKEKSEMVLDGWECFSCEKCHAEYKRMPLNGVCSCGWKLLICYHGSIGDKIRVV